MSNRTPKQKPSMRAVAAAAAAERERQEATRRRRILVGVAVGGVAIVTAIVVVVVLLAGSDSGSPTVQAPAVVGQLGCSSCHTTNGDRSEGPTWKGLFGSTVTLDDGSTVIADEAYLRRSITEPGAQVVQGYENGMPTKPVSSAQLDQLVAFIESLA